MPQVFDVVLRLDDGTCIHINPAKFRSMFLAQEAAEGCGSVHPPLPQNASENPPGGENIYTQPVKDCDDSNPWAETSQSSMRARNGGGPNCRWVEGVWVCT